TSAAQKFYGRERQVQMKVRGELERYRMSAGSTADGRRMEVASNVCSAEEAEAALANGCDGIGLFRTEMMFVGRDTAPTEEEQFKAYSGAARAGKAAGNQFTLLRTFDAGGDKPVRFLPAPAKSDSSLGDRGILIYKEHSAVLQAQLRAMLRASAEGPLRIMFPLVSTVEELLWLREQVDAAKQLLAARGQAFDPQIELGIMIELPDAVPNLAALAEHADFFSIGTNDLAQYVFAQDRTRSKLDLRASVRHPEFLRLLREIAHQARQTKTWLGMCGEMAGDPINLPLLVGLNLDEISMGGDVLAIKARLSKLNTAACAELLEKAIGCSTIKEVDVLLAGFAAQGDASLRAQQLVIAGSVSSTREDAIRELTDLFYIYGRTAEPDRLENAIWEREATYPTDMGFGFALPHCKTSAALQSSVALLRPATPFLWSEESTVPVRLVIMLAMREEGAAHMQVLARLARKLMDEEFREGLLSCTDPSAALKLLIEAGVS
ncbi:MAG TPA: putative PEP-binding protein, partial [Terriglobales bacterium]|nr:putative PEP-binding protein [Terriglobales bacterium]